MYISKDIYWTLIPTVSIHFSGSKEVNYSASIVFAWLCWKIHAHWYEGNENKAPF